MVTSDFRPEVENIALSRMRNENIQYNAYVVGTVRSLWTCCEQIPRSTERISSFV